MEEVKISEATVPEGGTAQIRRDFPSTNFTAQRWLTVNIPPNLDGFCRRFGCYEKCSKSNLPKLPAITPPLACKQECTRNVHSTSKMPYLPTAEQVKRNSRLPASFHEDHHHHPPQQCSLRCQLIQIAGDRWLQADGVLGVANLEAHRGARRGRRGVRILLRFQPGAQSVASSHQRPVRAFAIDH